MRREAGDSPCLMDVGLLEKPSFRRYLTRGSGEGCGIRISIRLIREGGPIRRGEGGSGRRRHPRPASLAEGSLTGYLDWRRYGHPSQPLSCVPFPSGSQIGRFDSGLEEIFGSTIEIKDIGYVPFRSRSSGFQRIFTSHPRQACYAICGMIGKRLPPFRKEKPMVAITAYGINSACALLAEPSPSEEGIRNDRLPC